MQLNTSMHQGMHLKQVLAPRMIQSMEILQMPIMALQERIEHELQENPVLELRDVVPEDDAPTGEPDEIVSESADGRDLDKVEDPELDAVRDDWADHFNEDSRPSSNRIDDEMDKKHDAMANMASRPQSLQDYLNDQISYLDLDAKMLELVRYLISNLDDRGYLGRFDEHKNHHVCYTLEELVDGLGGAVSVDELAEALKRVQDMDPPGVGARDYKECLLLQVTNDTSYRDVVRVLIQNHLENIQQNRLGQIQKETGYDLETLQEAIEVLRHLDPKPGLRFTTGTIQYVVPDIVVDQNEAGEYEVKLLDDWTPNIYISKRYVEFLREKGADQKAKEYLARKIQAAKWLLEAIEQRRSTLTKVTKAIIQHQKAFLEKGPEHIEPLKMQQIADQVGVHVTTVSRAVDDKWVQTMRGIFPLKRFFGGGTRNETTGEDVAWEVIKQKLLDIISAEDKASPFSDEELVDKLAETGYPVARRTVTKYRKMLHIQSSRQRKVWTGNGASSSAKKESVVAVSVESDDGEPQPSPEPERMLKEETT